MTEIDDVFSLLGFGRMQWIIFFASFLIQMWMTNEQVGFSVVLAAASCDLGIDDYRMAWLMAANFAVQMLLSLYFGSKADAVGRRKLILITATSSCIFSGLSAFMPEFWSFTVMRICASAFVTAPTICLMPYVGEFSKISLRPRVLNYLNYALGMSVIYVPAIACGILPLELPIGKSWRVLIMMDLLPGIIGLIMLALMPESPKFYLSIGKEEKAMKVMEKCCRLNKGKDVTLASLGVDSLTQPRLRTPSERLPSKAMVPMCRDVCNLLRDHAKNMLLLTSTLFIFIGISFGMPLWMLRIRVLMKEGGDTFTVCEFLHDESIKPVRRCDLTIKYLLDPILHGCVLLGLFIITSILLLFLGRRAVILIYISTAIGGSLALNFVRNAHLILASFLAQSVPPLCCGRLIFSILIDVIPTHLRGKAASIGGMMARFGVLMLNLFVGYTLSWNCYVTLNSLLLILVVGAIIVCLFPSERKMRKMTLHYAN